MQWREYWDIIIKVNRRVEAMAPVDTRCDLGDTRKKNLYEHWLKRKSVFRFILWFMPPDAPMGATQSWPIRVLTFTTLYPNAARPTHGVFVENRLRHLVASGRVDSRVVAPAPWIPGILARIFPTYSTFARVPQAENRHGLAVKHPRFVVLPKIGMTLAPFLLGAGVSRAIRSSITENGDFDLIDAHYFYPDGVAAVRLGRILNKPVIITARGSDINLIAKYALPRRMIRYAANRAAAVITVSQALKEVLVELGISPSKVHVLRNGVDLEMFSSQDRTSARAHLGVQGPTLLAVGQLVDLKSHDLIIRALRDLPSHALLIVGDGPDRSKLEQLAAKLGVACRVRFLGQIAHERLPQVYSVADALVLASSREGWPNVLLEAMACGTPVVASRIGGIPEVVTCREAGVLLGERSPAGIVAAVNQLFRNPPDRAATRRYAERFSWDATTQGQIELFAEVLARASFDRVPLPAP